MYADCIKVWFVSVRQRLLCDGSEFHNEISMISPGVRERLLAPETGAGAEGQTELSESGQWSRQNQH